MQLVKTRSRAGMALALFAVIASAPIMAQEHEEGENHDQAGTSHYSEDFAKMATKFIELAEAMPADKYSWQPMDGVRTVSQVFMLMAAEYYAVPTAWGVETPEGVPPGNQAFAAFPEVTDKEEVLSHLRKSSEHFSAVIENMDAETMHSEIQFFGQTRSVMEAVFIIAGDMHEHLGQAIAYARMNEVVPPWTARVQASQSN